MGDSMACDLGECGHIGVCIPDPKREYRGWCPNCHQPVYGDQPHTVERRTNGVTPQNTPVHDRCPSDGGDLALFDQQMDWAESEQRLRSRS